MTENTLKKQRTISKSFEFSGVGIHSGVPCKVKVQPAGEDHGIIFERNGTGIPAMVRNVTTTDRCTSIGMGNTEISTIEHFMAACIGLEIDNLMVKVDGDELPILDGSSKEIVQMLKKAGVSEQKKDKKILKVEKLLTFRDGNSFILATPAPPPVKSQNTSGDSSAQLPPAPYFSLSVMVDFDRPHIGMQMVQFNPEKDNFEEKIAPARTFGFKEEVDDLIEKQLAKGGSLDNALIISNEGYVNEPRFEDEVVKHKCLDVLGDLALAGGWIEGHIFAFKPGHKINVEFVKMLMQHCEYMNQQV